MTPNLPHRTTLLAVALLLPAASHAASTDPTGVTQLLGQLPGNVSNQQVRAASGNLGSATSLPAAAPAITAPATTADIQAPQTRDYAANQRSDVFGANLFTGAFARDGATQFNPDYAIAIGDQIQVRFWGAFEFNAPVTVDPKGNIFLPNVGPVFVLGAHNQDLQRLVETAASRVFRSNVQSYASLAAAQPVRVFVSGFVNRPGLFDGTSMDSLLHYLDQAGGIDLERGSFLNIQVKRGKQTRASFNLYDFILLGQMPLIQLTDGDVIFVSPRQHSVSVTGLAGNAKRFEFNGQTLSVADIAKLAKPSAQATHARIIRNTGTTKNTEYYPLAQAAGINLQSGDEIQFTADKKPGTITIRVEGEHLSQQEYVVPYGTRLGSLMQQVRYSDRADKASLQLFRQTVKDRQKLMLQTALKHLEEAVLTVRSGTTEEAALRKEEAELMLQWVDRAKAIEPSGQVMLAQADNPKELLLENGDLIRIPAIDNLVLVSGEVMFPNTIALDSRKSVEDYISTAGGYAQNADTSRIVIAHRDGSFEDTAAAGWFSSTKVRPGDEILVLPKVDAKYRQLFKEVSTMIYQMALGARIVLR